MSTPEEIQADIERQRAQLAGTVDQLSRKLDVKTNAKAKVADVKDRSTTADGKPAPELIGAAVGALVAVVVLVWRRHRS